jgi:hypothetical protein
VRPAPQFDPPYDDEPPAPVMILGPVVESVSHGRDPERPEDPERLWAPRPPGPAVAAPPRAGAGGQAAYRYVGLCLEVLDGFRPAAHLRRLTLATAFETVLDQLARPAARTGHPSSADPISGGATTTGPGGVLGRGPGGAAGTAGGGTGGAARTAAERRGVPSAGRLRLRRLRVGEPSDGVVEAAAVVGRAERAWALALRLERRDNVWLCTDLCVV